MENTESIKQPGKPCPGCGCPYPGDHTLDCPIPAEEKIKQLRETLIRIKAQVCGDKRPNWTDDWATTNTRGWIADVCDEALK